MRLTLATAVLTALVLTGCGDDAGSEDAAPSSEGTPDAPDSGTPTELPLLTTCPYLSDADAATGLGQEVELDVASVTTCLFDATETGARITVTLTDIATDVDSYAEGTRALCEDELTEVEAGDDAFVCTTFAGPQGFVFSGEQSVLVEVSGAEDDVSATGALTALLPLVTLTS